jgi:hypothetical protein
MKKGCNRALAVILASAFIFGCNSTIGFLPASAEETEAASYQHYIGMIHDHTGDSDGTGTPEEAYTYARDVSGFDFEGITDHAHMLNTQEKFDEQCATADSFNKDGSFVTLPGFEMSYYADGGWWGHINSFNTEWVELNKTMNENIDYYYSRLKDTPASVSQFNHPGYVWGDFDDFAHYDEQVDAVMKLVEVSATSIEPEYIRALDKGWHVSPTNSDDNHSSTPGKNGAATVILAKSLTRNDLLDGIRANRTYGTQDSSLRLELTGNGAMMGSRLSGIDKLSLNLKVDYQKDTVGTVKIISRGGQVVAEKTFDENTADWTVDVPVGDKTYYFARLITGDKKYAVSAPIWVENEGGLRGTDSDIGMNQSDKDLSYEVKFNLKNTSDKTISDISVGLYRKGVQQGAEYTLPMLAAGAEKEIRIPAAYQAEAQDVMVWIKGNMDGVSIGTSLTVNLPELIMTEFNSSTMKGDYPADGFAFLEFYNASPEEKNLKDYYMLFFTLHDS